jgi:replicative DNA helicase
MSNTEDNGGVVSRPGFMPRADDAEKGLLSSMLQDGSVVDEFGELPVEAMYDPGRRQIFEFLREMRGARKPIDLVTVTDFIESRGVIDEVGGAHAIAELFTFVPTTMNKAYYGEILWDKWQRRQVVAAAGKMQALARDESREIDEVMAEVDGQARMLVTNAPTQTSTIRHCGDCIGEALHHIEMVHQKRGKTVGIATGIHDWDRMTGGLMGGDMIVVAGRPSHGKSALGMQVALHAAAVQAIPTLVFSVEMPSMQLMLRALCAGAKVDLQRVRDGFFSQGDMKNLSETANGLAESRLYIDDSAGLTTAQFRARAREAHGRHGVRFIVVDYLQFMHGATKRSKESRQLEVSEISGTMKEVAKELKVPVVVLAQLNRDAEEYAKPKLSHLRDSGSIEQDADQVALIHRLDKQRKKKGRDEEEFEEDHNAVLLLEKQRMGPTGEIKLWFDDKYTTFRNVTEKRYSNNSDERQR